MFQDSKRTYTAIVLLKRRLVWRRERRQTRRLLSKTMAVYVCFECRRRVRGLLKLSIAEQTHGNMKSFFFFIYNKETATTDKALLFLNLLI